MFDRIIRLSIGNSVFVHLLFVLVVAAGIMSAFRLPREEFPEISLDRVIVSVAYPGATAADVEELILRPIEESLSDVGDIDEYSSRAIEGGGNVVVTFADGTDLKDARAELEKAVASIENLPEDAETPVVKEMTLEIPVISVALAGDPGATLVVDRIADELRDIRGVSTVNVSGLAERKIVIDVDEQKLRVLGLSPGQIAEAVRAAQASLPAGNVQRSGQEIFVKTEKRLQGVQDVARIPVRPGSSRRIGDVADVREIRDPADTRFWVGGEEAVKLTVGREESADPISIREDVLQRLPELQRFVPAGLELIYAEDFTNAIRSRLDTVFANALSGGALVLLVLLVMSGVRQAVLALIGMPVSYFAALFLMDTTGLTINVVSTFGLLIATGIIVDDAIVVIENVQRHLEMGKSRVKATLDGTREVLLPVTAAVLTTMLAFVPLTMVGGTMGRVMRILPLAVIFCLLGSLLEAIFILPGHLSEYASTGAKNSRTARLVRHMQAVYRPALKAATRFKWVTILLVTIGFFGTAALASTMPMQIGAPGKPHQLEVHFEVSPGLTREVTRTHGQALDEWIREQLPEDSVRVVSLRVGSIRDNETGVERTGANLAQVRWQFETTDAYLAAYPAMVRALRQRLATDPDMARTTVQEVQAGPPTGAAVTARIRGRDPNQLDAAMADVKEALYAMDGISDVRDNYGAGKETFRVEVDQDRASLYGLTERAVAQAVRTAVDGLLASEVSIDEESVEILVRYAGARDKGREALRDLLITNAAGKAVRLDQVASIERTREVSDIRREDGLRTVVVYADTDEKRLAPADAAADLKKVWEDDVGLSYPDLTLSFGGEADELADSLRDLPMAFMLAFCGIYIVLALQFRSYVQPVIILAAVPFGLMGAIWGLSIGGFPLSLMAMFGLVALTGIVVNDSLVMVDFINKRRREGVPLHDAVHQGAMERLRPIVATTLTTCLGLLPLSIGLGGQDLVLAPMAIAITAGLGFATLLVLLVVPAVYLVVEGIRARFGGKPPGDEPNFDDDDDPAWGEAQGDEPPHTRAVHEGAPPDPVVDPPGEAVAQARADVGTPPDPSPGA